MSVLSELRDLQQEINEVYNSDLDWDVKYDLIFSERLSRKVFKLIRLDYYDPDTTYQEDVTAFVNALNEKLG